MTFTKINTFVETEDWMHAYSPECNNVAGFEGLDATIAYYASILARCMIVPVLYEMSNILIPGIPTFVVLMDDIDEDDPKSTYLHWFKFSTVLSPDLVL